MTSLLSPRPYPSPPSGERVALRPGEEALAEIGLFSGLTRKDTPLRR